MPGTAGLFPRQLVATAMTGTARAAYRLPATLRTRLQEPFAEIVDEPTFLAQVRSGHLGRPLIAVGDIVAVTLIKHGLEPELVIYDLGTKREPVSVGVKGTIEAYEAVLLSVENPPATITDTLLAAIQRALDMPGPVKIRVHGEEDLAALPCITNAPEGGTVIYGMPNRGLVPVPVTSESRRRAEELLSLMKVGPAPAAGPTEGG